MYERDPEVKRQDAEDRRREEDRVLDRLKDYTPVGETRHSEGESMATFTIERAEKVKEFQGKSGGMFDVYALQLAGRFQPVELVQRGGSPPPSGTIEGEIVAGPYGEKLNKAQGGGFRGGGAGKSPTERAEIRRLASHKVAVELLGHQIKIATLKQEPEKFAGATAQSLLLPLIDFLDEDAKKAGEAA